GEPRQGSERGAAAARARLRGLLRPHAGNALPPCRAVPAVADRQEAAGLPLRPARGDAGLRAGARLRTRRLAVLAARTRLSPALPELAPGVVVGVRRLLLGALLLRHVPQAHADARPGARAAPHRVDEDVVFGQSLRRARVARLPPLQAGDGILFVLRIRDDHERLRGLTAAGGRSLSPRRSHAGRLSLLLLVVR